jgi:hypothetical protein
VKITKENINELIDYEYHSLNGTWKKEHFNSFVITGLIDGDNSPLFRIGRVVQVRLEAGEYGSDLVLLRRYDGILTPHENQSFYLIKPEYLESVKDLFSEIELDEPNLEYTLRKEFPETGFIIPSKIKEGESTPMRNIKNALYNEINKYVDKLG